MDEAILEWFENERGIRPETLGAFGVWQDGSDVVFPYANGEKRRPDPTKPLDGKRRFYFDKGKVPDLFFTQDFPFFTNAFLVEGETDTLRLWQDIGDQCDVAGLSGIETWKPQFAERFKDHQTVYVILDNDEDYNVAARVDACWKKIRADLGKKAKRVYLPAGVKDICEFFETYDVEMLRELVMRKQVRQSSFEKLDLLKPLPPMDWLVDSLICAGDVNLVVGDPSLGKSWLMMDLAVKIAGKGGTWLGHEIKKRGSVLYIDEENPEDIIVTRFKKLGLTDSEAPNIEFLYRPGIWLNKDPEPLLEEALELEPALIVFDSLSRIHSEDENSANAMARLFREGITPFARETGAAVCVIHHTVKGDTNNSFQRTRGSGDITAVVDAGLDVRGTEIPGRLTVGLYKSRRRAGGELITVQIEDTPEGGVELTTTSLPF